MGSNHSICLSLCWYMCVFHVTGKKKQEKNYFFLAVPLTWGEFLQGSRKLPCGADFSVAFSGSLGIKQTMPKPKATAVELGSAFPLNLATRHGGKRPGSGSRQKATTTQLFWFGFGGGEVIMWSSRGLDRRSGPYCGELRKEH